MISAGLNLFLFFDIISWDNTNVYHRIGIRKKVSKGIQKSLIFYQLRINVMQFGNTNCRCLSNIWIFILQTFAQWFTEVLGDLIHPNATHGSYCQGSDKWVGVLTVLKIQLYHNLMNSLYAVWVKQNPLSRAHHFDFYNEYQQKINSPRVMEGKILTH